MNTDDYKRGYGKGYSTGMRNSDRALAEQRARADEAALRAERAEQAQGVGHCENCRHWHRGDHRPNFQQCAWGTCQAPRAPGTPWGTFVHFDEAEVVTTTPRFGCVLFLPIHLEVSP